VSCFLPSPNCTDNILVADSGAAPYLLAATADIKAYIKAKGYRHIPIGYSATDTAVLRPMLQDYVVCRPNITERCDFYALNSYEWCGASATYMTSGYSQLQAAAVDYPVPIFFSEDGCNTVPPRDFNDQSAIFGPNMVDTWSGAIIYEWIQETNDYGLVSYGPQQSATVNEGSSVVEGFTRQGTPTPVAPDFTNLQGQWATLTPTGVSQSAYAATAPTSVPSCPAFTSGGWTVDPSAALPTIGAAGVSPGIPSNVPQGSITSGSSGSSASSAASSSASAQNAAGKTNANPLSSGEASFLGAAIALLTVGGGAVLLL
jgi:1,3-beta-glucanosyltransferase GAS1